MKKLFFVIMVVTIGVFSVPFNGGAAENEELSYTEKLEKRMDLYVKMETITQVPWYYLAAADSYDRGVRKARRDLAKESGVIGIYFPPEKWVGEINPNLDDKNPLSISMFGGVGLDGNGDDIVDINDDDDVLYTFAKHLQAYGFDDENIKIGMWDFYKRDQAVQLIMGHAKVYKTYNTLDLSKNAFPLPRHFNYSYKNTWGDARGWGGRRIHEGTDIFANYGVPVRATTYGVVELKGWNKFGGWRIGVRDTDNVYHYFAHLSGFEKGVNKGMVVEPGTVLGYVGSSGYGKPGTQGKFPPHLHYGMYRDNGFIEWSFDPYPSLRRWEQQDRKRK